MLGPPRMTVAIWIATGALFAMVATLLVFMVMLFWPSTPGERLGAVAAVLGGLFGAGGAAVAVYLTLVAQREDEAQKVEAALRMEVAEFGRLVLGPLYLVSESILVAKARVPIRDLPALVAMPDAVVYKATADRLSRLSYGVLFVVFHARLAEAIRMATIYAATAPRVFGQQESPLVVDEDKARTLATAWLDICTIGRTIPRAGESASQLSETAIKEALQSLDDAYARASQILAPTGEKPSDSDPR